MTRLTLTNLAKLAIVELVAASGECRDVREIAKRVVALGEERGVAVDERRALSVVKSVLSRIGPQLGACWASGAPGRVCPCPEATN